MLEKCGYTYESVLTGVTHKKQNSKQSNAKLVHLDASSVKVPSLNLFGCKLVNALLSSECGLC